MKSKLSKFLLSKSFWLFAVCYLAFCILFIFFKMQLGPVRPATQSYRIAGNALLIFLPYWFLKPRWRPAVLAPVWLLALWCAANLWYFRLWHDIASPASLTMVGNAGTLLFRSVLGLWRPVDLWFLIVPMGVTALYFLLFRRCRAEAPYRWPLRLACFAISLLVFACGELLTSRSIIKNNLEHNGHYDYNLWQETLRRHKELIPSNLETLEFKGLCFFLVEYLTSIIELQNSEIELSQTELADIRSLIQANLLPPADSFSHKNLIVVIVESLNADVVGRRVNGHEITPTLNALAADSGSVVALNVVSQVKDGGSSDGQLLINSGLFGLRKGAQSINFAQKNKFPSLRSLLPANYSSAAILADDGLTWQESLMQQNFGYDTVFTKLDLTGEQLSRGRDAAMFSRAPEILAQLSQPFLLELISISMHAPHVEAGVDIPQWLSRANLPSADLARYYAVTNYFDAYLGCFINYLKDSGLWDNTMLVVTSDHNVSSVHPNQEFVPAFFLAANTGRTEKIDRVVGQINIFPTILELMGAVDFSTTYSGLAPSMLNPRVCGSLTPAYEDCGQLTDSMRNELIEAYELSDKIHRGGYFGRK